ncbi:MAG: transcriptional regulator [Bacilli bacterium]|nr:transcriptional regulator [Bacilli bacterium]
MNYNEQTNALLSKLFNEQKNHMFSLIENSQCGMKKALFLIYLSDHPLCAHDIGNSLNISMARTTVLLQKLEKKNYIKREIDSNDKRRIFIKLTEEGIKNVENYKNHIYKIAKYLNEKIGYEKLYTFIDIMKDINQKLEEYGEVEIC